MMITSLLLRTWVVQMKAMKVEPNILADDLQIISIGTRHAEHFQHAFDKTHERLEDLGATLAPAKSITFSSELATRNWMRTHRWRRQGKVVKVVTDCMGIWGTPPCNKRKKEGGDAVNKDEGDHEVDDKVGANKSTVSHQSQSDKRQDDTKHPVWV